MTAEEIASRARALTVFDDVEINGGQVRFLARFWVDYEVEEEPHDAAWDCRQMLQEHLRSVRLCACDVDSDNDSVWGTIEERA